MQNEAQLELIRKKDPSALRLVIEDQRLYYAAKRVMDFLIALLLLLLFSPLMLLIAIAIMVYSPGPIFFVQERVGAKRELRDKYSYWRKATFSCYKFRTMQVDADPSVHQEYVKALIENDHDKMAMLQGESTQIRKLVSDPRVTPLGKLLRKLSLDELPQFWNVLRGDMSLVGPRPAIPYEVEIYSARHSKRLEAQPGITGLQQITSRSTADFDEQVELDIQYIASQSLWLDIKIMLKTPFVVLTTKGAQ